MGQRNHLGHPPANQGPAVGVDHEGGNTAEQAADHQRPDGVRNARMAEMIFKNIKLTPLTILLLSIKHFGKRKLGTKLKAGLFIFKTWEENVNNQSWALADFLTEDDL